MLKQLNSIDTKKMTIHNKKNEEFMGNISTDSEDENPEEKAKT